MSRKPPSIAVIDFETDPFKIDRVPAPFAVEFLSDTEVWSYWGLDAAQKLVEFLETIQKPKYTIFAHNGGKFDFHFMVDYLDNPVRIINSRIVSAKLGVHTLRDSYALIPVGLAKYQKDKIDYALFEPDVRENHKAEIMAYLHSDCVYLLKLVSEFVERYGMALTAPSAAMRELKKHYEFATMDAQSDQKFRPYYFGGRVECFETGLLSRPVSGPWKLFDINSSYPKAMRDTLHPKNNSWDIVSKLPNDPNAVYFAHIDATSRGALPVRLKDGIHFPHTRTDFYACSHEINAALKLGLLDIHGIFECQIANETTTFETFIDPLYSQKVEAKKNKDTITEIFTKLLQNSAYGKFATNPEHFKDYYLARDYHEMLAECMVSDYEIEYEGPNYWILAKPSENKERGLYDVSTGASITSRARAHLLEGLALAGRPVYCDTDSIICESFEGNADPLELGAWKLEASADFAAIAGKKMYTLYNSLDDEKPQKLASKGGTLSMQNIVNLCEGGEIEYTNKVPAFRINAEPKFITRKFKKTA